MARSVLITQRSAMTFPGMLLSRSMVISRLPSMERLQTLDSTRPVSGSLRSSTRKSCARSPPDRRAAQLPTMAKKPASLTSPVSACSACERASHCTSRCSVSATRLSTRPFRSSLNRRRDFSSATDTTSL